MSSSAAVKPKPSSGAKPDSKEDVSGMLVGAWLRQVWDGRYYPKSDVDGWVSHIAATHRIQTVGELMRCDDNDLKELVPLLGPRIELRQALRELRGDAVMGSVTSADPCAVSRDKSPKRAAPKQRERSRSPVPTTVGRAR